MNSKRMNFIYINIINKGINFAQVVHQNLKQSEKGVAKDLKAKTLNFLVKVSVNKNSMKNNFSIIFLWLIVLITVNVSVAQQKSTKKVVPKKTTTKKCVVQQQFQTGC